MLHIRKLMKPYRAIFSLTTIKQPVHNPFQSLPLDELLKLASKTDMKDSENIFFYQCFFRTIVDNHNKLKPNTVLQINKKVDFIMSQMTKNMQDVDIKDLLTITERICECLIKKVFLVEKKILISYFIKFQCTLVPILEKDSEGKYYKQMKSIIPHMLESRRGTSTFDKFIDYIFKFAQMSNSENISQFLLLMLAQYQRTNHSITVAVFNFLQEKMVPFMEENYESKEFLMDILLLKFFITYEFHKKKPEFGIPVWFIEYLEKIKLKFSVSNLEIPEFDKLQYLELRMKLYQNVPFSTRLLHLHKKEILYLLNYFQEIYDLIRRTYKTKNFKVLNQFMSTLLLYQEIIQKQHYFKEKSLTGKQIIKFMIEGYLTNPINFEQLCEEGKNFYESIFRFIRFYNIQFQLPLENKLMNFLEGCIESMSIHDHFVFFCEMYVWKLRKHSLEAKEKVKKKILTLDSAVQQFRMFEIFRYFYVAKNLKISLRNLEQVFRYEIAHHPEIFSRSICRCMFYDEIFQDAIHVFNEVIKDPKIDSDVMVKYMFLPMKIRYPDPGSKSIRQALIYHFIKNGKLNQIFLRSKKSWSSIFFYLRNPFSILEFYQMELFFQLFRICDNLAFTDKIYIIFKDRVLQNGWLLKIDQIHKIKLVSLLRTLAKTNFFKAYTSDKQDYIAPFLHYILHSATSLLTINSDYNKFLQRNVLSLARHVIIKGKQAKFVRAHKGVLDKIWLWFDSQGLGVKLLNQFALFPSQTFIKYLEEYYNPLYLLNFHIFCDMNNEISIYNEVTKRLKIQQSYKQLQKILKFIKSEEPSSLSYSQVIQLCCQRSILRSLSSKSYKYLLNQLIKREGQLTYEQFSVIVCIIRSFINEKIFTKEIDDESGLKEWIGREFMTYTSHAPSQYLHDYLCLSEWVGCIIPYAIHLQHYIEENLQNGSIFLVPELLARKYLVSSSILQDYINKLTTRMVWEYTKDKEDFFELVVLRGLAWVLLHEDVPMIEQFVKEGLVDLNLTFLKNQQLCILSILGKVATILIKESETKSINTDEIITILENNTPDLKEQVRKYLQPSNEKDNHVKALPNVGISLHYQNHTYYYPQNKNTIYIDIIIKYLNLVSGCSVQKLKVGRE